MTNVSIDRAAIRSSIQKGLAGAASALAIALKETTRDLPVTVTHESDGDSHYLHIDGQDIPRLLSGSVTTAGRRIPANPFIAKAIAQVDLAAEFIKNAD